MTDETSQHEVVRWHMSLSMSCVFGKDPASAENHSDTDTENTRREIRDGNGHADMLNEEQARQHIKAMLLKSSIKARKIATTHSNLPRAEAEVQEQEQRERERVVYWYSMQ